MSDEIDQQLGAVINSATAMARRVTALQSQVDAMRADAERYRWLRTNIAQVDDIRKKSHTLWTNEGDMSGKDAFDRTVDAARQPPATGEKS